MQPTAAKPKTFGRRTGFVPPASSRSAPARGRVEAAQPTMVAHTTVPPAIDHELQQWRQARRKAYRLPWAQLSLMASLCFGVASLVLPDSVNENVNWLLYALSAMSLVAWFTARRRKAKS
jgi:hypothetical protein